MVKRYLSLLSLTDALERIGESFSFEIRSGSVPLDESVGQITARPIFANFSAPELNLSAMDGIAVRSGDTIGASEQHPVDIRNAVRVNTGNVVPPGYDAVIMIEHVQEIPDGYRIRAPVSPWQHIRPVGEDIGESEMIIPSYHLIQPSDVGALASFGVPSVDVLSLSVGLLPTGSELVPVGTRPPPGKVVESNMHLAAAYLRDLGATCTIYPIAPDDPDAIRTAVQQGIGECDILIVSAGTSKGTRDFTAEVIGELGEVLIHGVAIKPGKPVIIGRIGGKPVIGMPGYPLACYTVLREIVRRMFHLYGLPTPDPETLNARLTTTLSSDIGTDEYVLLSVGRIGDHWVAVPQSRGAGVQMSLVRANAYMTIPSHLEGVAAGENVRATLLVPNPVAEETMLITGSHDPALDYLADLVRKDGVLMHSTHTGSMGGLLALKKGECHAAPMHLLSPGGDYNVPFLERLIPEEELVLLCVAEREQGIVSQTGLGFKDLVDHTFVNRQKGSGTRMLLDYLLKNEGIVPAAIRGYDREMTTHLAVALTVKTGDADAGMCVYSAARALGLSFVPVGKERYELVARKETLEEDVRLRKLFDTIGSQRFGKILRDLGGYDITLTGVLRELP